MAILYVCGLGWLAMKFPYQFITDREGPRWSKMKQSFVRILVLRENWYLKKTWIDKLVRRMCCYKRRNTPHIQEILFPFVMRKKWSNCSKAEMELLKRDIISYRSFLNIWKYYFSHVKIKQVSYFFYTKRYVCHFVSPARFSRGDI